MIIIINIVLVGVVKSSSSLFFESRIIVVIPFSPFSPFSPSSSSSSSCPSIPISFPASVDSFASVVCRPHSISSIGACARPHSLSRPSKLEAEQSGPLDCLSGQPLSFGLTTWTSHISLLLLRSSSHTFATNDRLFSHKSLCRCMTRCIRADFKFTRQQMSARLEVSR